MNHGSRRGWFGVAAAAVLTALALVGWTQPAPGSSECSYLLSAARSVWPSFLANDWTFGVDHSKTFVFDRVAGALISVSSIEATAWIGRALVFFGLFSAIIGLGTRLGLGWAGAGGAAALWMLLGQSPVGFSRPVGFFIPGAIAWGLGLFSLQTAIDGRPARTGILIGLAVAVHPLVGGTLSLALAAGLLVQRTSLQGWARVLGWAAVAALPGLIPLIGGLPASTFDAASEWRFQALYRLPIHLDWARFHPAHVGALATMIALALLLAANSTDRAWRFLVAANLALVPIFLVGVVATAAERYQLLVIYPFRVLPPVTLLVFCFGLVKAWRERATLRWRWPALALALVSLVLLPSPWLVLQDNNDWVRKWRNDLAPTNDHTAALRWLATHSPTNATLVVSPTKNCAPYFSRRAQVSYFDLARYDRLAESRERFEAHVGRLPQTRLPAEYDRLFNSLPEPGIRKLVTTYGGDYLVSRGQYPYPVVYTSGRYRVYDLSVIVRPSGPE